MSDHLEALIANAERLVASGYYDRAGPPFPGRKLSTTLSAHAVFPIIAEVKLASPSLGRVSSHTSERLIADYISAGAAAISVLTEPNRFGGSLGGLELAAGSGLPLLMKDIVVSETQVEAAASLGASAVLLIQEVFGGPRSSLREDLIDRAHGLGLEVLLEAGSEGTLIAAMSSEADILGINQRDLRTFQMDRGKAARLLPLVAGRERPVVVMSGIDGPTAVAAARNGGAGAVLVGGHLSSAGDPAGALRELVVPR